MSPFSWKEENEEQSALMGALASDSTQTRYYKKRNSLLCGIVAFLTVIVAALISILAVVLFQKGSDQHEGKPSWLPPQQQINRVFWPQDVFAREPNTESEAAWDSLFPEGGGFVEINGTEASNLQLSERRAVLSVFHQFHCLRMIRTGYFAAASGNPDDVDQGPGHLSHCWDYLHQAIMCHGDTTLEWVHEGDPGSSGWGYEHQCKDFAAIFSWVEARKSVNHTGIPTVTQHG
ncbi:hypothetical protein ANO14919_080660 [Xylariales sp. No.14919]|nr:hypothetical protein ANO14919_080660 [Xylariales sp. No.14919]